LKIWRIGTGNPNEQLVIPADKNIACLAFAKDGKVLVSGGSDRYLHYWSTTNLSEMYKVKAHDAAVTALALIP
jgi:WD40 repeat protein